MPRIGNDVVNLSDPAAAGKSGNTRFLSRVFTPSERRLTGCDAAVWSLWAAKETAFKVVSKTGPVSGSPLRFEVVPEIGPAAAPIRSGIVETPRGRIFFRLAYGPGYVHCIGSDDPDGLDAALWGIERVEGGQESSLARKAAAAAIASSLGVPPEEVGIRTVPNGWGGRPPAAFLRGEAIPGDLSLSHDGPYVAYAFVSPFTTATGGRERSGFPGPRPRWTWPLSAESRPQTAQSFLR